MARRTSRQIAHMRVDRQNVWGSISIQEQTVAANTQVLLGTLSAAFLLLRPFTIVRTHLKVHWRVDQSGATETPNGALGHVVVNDQAAGIGVTAVPDPITNADASFFVWQPLITDILLATAVGFDTPAGSLEDVDSKAMRKVGPNEDMAITMANESASDGGIITIIGRMLVKLH